MNAADTKRRDKILNGKLIPVIFSICLPLFIYNFFNTIYSFIDTIMVSNISAEGVSSVAAISQIKELFAALGSGLASGGGILIARAFGANDIEKGKKFVNTLTSLGLIVCIVLFLCIPFANPILLLCGYPKDLIGIGTGYFIVQLINLAVVLFNSIFISIQKAKGDTKPIFFLNIIAMLIKLGLTSFFIYVVHVDNTIYIALSTLISQIALFIILFLQTNKKDSIFKVNFLKFSFPKDLVKQIIILSLPIFLGKFVFSFGKVSVNAMCAQYGSMVVGALAVSNSICGIATSPLNSFEEGGSTIVSQNLGNNNTKRALQAFVRTLIIAILCGIIGYILIRFVFQPNLISLFSKTKSTGGVISSEEFMALIKSINDYDTLSIPALAINSAVLGVLYGFKKTKLTMIINISRVFLFRIPVLWYLQTFHPEMGAECAGISMGVSNILIAIMSVVVLLIFLYSIKHEHKNKAKFKNNYYVEIKHFEHNYMEFDITIKK